jgi:hypothetical protein
LYSRDGAANRSAGQRAINYAASGVVLRAKQ